MLYELHMTLADDALGGAGWQDFCNLRGIKPLKIELHGGGAHPVQIMTAQTTECDPGDAMSWAGIQREKFINHGWGIQRVKLEVPLDYGIGVYDDPVYHEVHVKLLSEPDMAPRYVERAVAYGWVASRNLWYTEVAGLEKWYLTLRAYDVPALKAADKFAQAWEDIRPFMPPAARMEKETVIFDSNPDLDAGWA
jgi:hypothetical protein